MGPGYRHDGMDAQWLFWNWQKIVGMGLSLHKKLFNAHLEAQDHQERFDRFSNLQLKDVPEWERMVQAWEKDHTQPNPYTVTKSGKCVTKADVKLALATQEAELVAKGVPALHDKVSASAFIVAGLGLQDQHLRSACHPGLDEIERMMRDAQCRVSLGHIRTHLYMKSGLTTYKQCHARHQKGNTRARKTIDDNDAKIKVFQDRYNTARNAL
ncbi:hypothetical protein PILCRDRAFT_34464, partial [Piloderma croceum F 1598]